MYLFIFKIENSKRVILPGVDWKSLKTVGSFLTPIFFLLPLFFVLLIAQVVDDLKLIFTSVEIQVLPSVKFYSKIIYFGFSSVSFSTFQSISQTLGSDLESLFVVFFLILISCN